MTEKESDILFAELELAIAKTVEKHVKPDMVVPGIIMDVLMAAFSYSSELAIGALEYIDDDQKRDEYKIKLAEYIIKKVTEDLLYELLDKMGFENRLS